MYSKFVVNGGSLIVVLPACANICQKPSRMKQLTSTINTTTKALIPSKYSKMQTLNLSGSTNVDFRCMSQCASLKCRMYFKCKE